MSQRAEVNNRQSKFSTKGCDEEGTMVGEKDNEKKKVVRSYIRVMTFTMSKMLCIAVVVKSLIVNRKEGQVVAKGVTRKVIDLDDHTL